MILFKQPNIIGYFCPFHYPIIIGYQQSLPYYNHNLCQPIIFVINTASTNLDDMQSQSLSTVDSLKPSLLNKETDLSFEHGITE